MIIFGSRASILGNFEASDIKCDYCHEERTQRVSVFGKYAHVFWIPVFPLGKKAVAECMHCKRTIDQKEFSPKLTQIYQEKKAKAKTPIWNWLGLGLVGSLIALITVIGITAEEDPRSDLLRNDENLMISSPTMESDSISYKIKQLFDSFATEEIDPEEFKYLTKIDGDKALILVQIPKLRKVEKEEREIALDMVEMVTGNQEILEDKDLYIGVKGLATMILIKTPTFQDNSRLASSQELYEYYGPKPASD
jgi:hypothetical protein